MNYPYAFLGLLVLTLLTGFSSCGQDHTNDDTSKPADGGTGGEAVACEDEQAKIKALEAELAECLEPKGEPK